MSTTRAVLYEPLLIVLPLTLDSQGGSSTVPLVPACADIFLPFLPILPLSCYDGAFALDVSLVSVLLSLPLLKFLLADEMVTLTISCGMLSLEATTNVFSGYGPSALFCGTLSLCCNKRMN